MFSILSGSRLLKPVRFDETRRVLVPTITLNDLTNP